MRLAGELDMDVADELSGLLSDLVGRRGATSVEVDLDEVTFLDSVALGALVAGFQAAGRAGRRFHVSHPHGEVRKILDVTGVLEPLTAPPA